MAGAAQLATLIIVAFLLEGTAAIRVQGLDIEGSLSYTDSAKAGRTAQIIDYVLFNKVVTINVSSLENKAWFELGHKPQNGGNYTMELRWDFIATDQDRHEGCHTMCYDQLVKQQCKDKCTFWFRQACESKCEERANQCEPICRGPQVFVSDKQGGFFGAVTGTSQPGWSYSWPEPLNHRASGRTISIELSLKNEDKHEGRRNADTGDWFAHQGFWSPAINGMLTPWLGREFQTSGADLDKGMYVNYLKAEGMVVQTVEVADRTCSVPCSNNECQENGENMCFVGTGVRTGAEHCFTFENRPVASSPPTVSRSCSISTQSTAQQKSCCYGYGWPCWPSSFTEDEVEQGMAWAEVLSGDRGAKIVRDICTAYQGPNPVSADDCAAMVGDKVRVEERMLSAMPYYPRWRVWHPKTNSTLELPAGMFTKDFTPRELAVNFPVGSWDIGLSDEGFVTHVGAGSPAEMSGVVPNRYFVTQIGSYAFGMNRWAQMKGKAMEIKLSEIPQNLGGECQDEPGWRDRDRHDCQRYLDNNWCTPRGAVNAATWKGYNRWLFWSRKYTIQSKANTGTGLSAIDACCACGGGTTAKSLELPKTTTPWAPPTSASSSTSSTSAAPTSSTRPVIVVCSQYDCLGGTRKPDAGDIACPEAGCTRDTCCDATCYSEVNRCPADFNFVQKANPRLIPCPTESCDPVETCCELAASGLLTDIKCSTCDNGGSAMSFDVTMQNVDYDTFNFDFGLKRQFETTVKQAVTVALSPYIMADSVHMNIHRGSVIAQVIVEAKGSFGGSSTTSSFKAFHLSYLMQKAIDQNTFREYFSAHLPDLTSATVAGGQAELTTITSPQVYNVFAEREDNSGPGQWWEGLKSLVKSTDPRLATFVDGVGLMNALLLFAGGATIFVMCCFATSAQEDEHDGPLDAGAGVSVISNASAASGARSQGGRSPPMATPKGSRGAESTISATSGASAVTSGSRADRVVPPVIQVSPCGFIPYPQRDEPVDAMKFYGQWSSGLFDVDHDLRQLFVALCCFSCFLPWRISTNVDRVGTIEAPCMHIKKENAWFDSMLSSVLFLLGVIALVHKVNCAIDGNPLDRLDEVLCEQGQADLIPGSVNLESVDTGIYVLLMLPMIYRQLIVNKAIALRYQIPESDTASWIKASFFICFASMQSGRHVDTYYAEHPRKRIAPPKLPIVGSTVKIRSSVKKRDEDEDSDQDQDGLPASLAGAPASQRAQAIMSPKDRGHEEGTSFAGEAFGAQAMSESFVGEQAPAFDAPLRDSQHTQDRLPTNWS